MHVCCSTATYRGQEHLLTSQIHFLGLYVACARAMIAVCYAMGQTQIDIGIETSLAMQNLWLLMPIKWCSALWIIRNCIYVCW